jgi:putative membrane protein insertion efficiency factor
MKPLDCARVASVTMQAVLRAYQLLISPLLLPSCRYLPTCSDYAIEALAQHGPLWGSAFALRRLARCHPWGGSGYDPVPVRQSKPDEYPRVPTRAHETLR